MALTAQVNCLCSKQSQLRFLWLGIPLAINDIKCNLKKKSLLSLLFFFNESQKNGVNLKSLFFWPVIKFGQKYLGDIVRKTGKSTLNFYPNAFGAVHKELRACLGFWLFMPGFPWQIGIVWVRNPSRLSPMLQRACPVAGWGVYDVCGAPGLPGAAVNCCWE